MRSPLRATTPPAAQAVETVIQDDAAILHSDTDDLRGHMVRIHELGFTRVRVTAGWSVIAPEPESAQRPEFDATDPAAYPRLKWANLDRAVRLARDAGLEVMIDIAFWAPRWATTGSTSEDGRHRTGISPSEFADFAVAVARRYSGDYAPQDQWQEGSPEPPKPPQRTSGRNALADFLQPQKAEEPQAEAPPPPPLPRVSLYTLWNEPNHPGFLMPQWGREGGKWVPVSADHYRTMLYAAYPAVKAVAPESTILVGATSSFGSTPGKGATQPLAFMRRLACVDEKLRPIRTGGCDAFREIPGDGWSHHPYSLRTAPDKLPRNRDDAPVAATSRLDRLVRRLVASDRFDPRLRDLYMTEYGYETNPPDPKARFDLEEQARFLAWAEQIALRTASVRMWPQFQLIDRPGHRAGPNMREFGDWQSGLYFEDGRAKPAASTYATPTYARCVRREGRRWVEVWGRARGLDDASAASVQSRRASRAEWRTVGGRSTPRARASRREEVAVRAGGRGVRRYVPYRSGARYRMVWEVSGASTSAGPDMRPQPCRSSGRQKG